ncbi:putative NBD/HSP70 family sugar kinase [Oribacterium sinus]|uniref:Putative NBD/HSP70 family sugar kinase n=1 Tax=Oribacterium sinus TaxID=237576 RepID=A0A7W9W367_9FIRM|nr:ROK family protein [Oribacterium sinus]MBB6042017.1 putative NBD/HSP70 family sugar kinase [Oribacterium sinus]
MEKRYFALDIGGTKTKYALLGEKGEILSTYEKDTEAQRGGSFILENVKGEIRRVLAELKGNPPEGAQADTKGDAKAERTTEAKTEPLLSGICISTAGMVDEIKGEIIHAGPQIPEYKGCKWKEEIERRFSIPCEVENDVKCAGLGEYSFGSGKGTSSMLCLTIGTGIGGSFILNGEVYHGTSHSAMEIGYMQIPGGMFQRMASTSALVKRVASRKGEPEELWNGKRIFEEVAKEDKICLEELDRLCDALSIGLSNLCYAFNPECIVLGGGIMEQKDILLPKIWGHLQEHLVPIVAENTRLLAASLGNRAGLLGAYVHFHNRQKSKA